MLAFRETTKKHGLPSRLITEYASNYCCARLFLFRNLLWQNVTLQSARRIPFSFTERLTPLISEQACSTRSNVVDVPKFIQICFCEREAVQHFARGLSGRVRDETIRWLEAGQAGCLRLLGQWLAKNVAEWSAAHAPNLRLFWNPARLLHAQVLTEADC